MTAPGESVKDIAVITRVGKPVCFKVMGFTKENGKDVAILSRREAQKECLSMYLSDLTPGDVVPSRVTHLDSFGAFVDIGCGMYTVALGKQNGGIQYGLDFISKRIRSKKGAELGVAGLSLVVDACTANNTVAIAIAGPIAKEISNKFEISPRRSASLLDIFSSVGQGLIPYGAQLLSAATLTGLTPYQIIPYMFYPILMAISAVMFIVIKKNKS